MAPDRGRGAQVSGAGTVGNGDGDSDGLLRPEDTGAGIQPEQSKVHDEHDFTWRGVLVGSLIGVIICFSNTYFGLQTGWVSGMAMPAALLGFGFFKAIARCLPYGFSPVENVLVQTVAGAVGTMPLGCGFVGVLPALEYLLKPRENGPLFLSTGKLLLWAVGICFFGCVFALPLRKEFIVREKLKFPSGTATALMIGVLHSEPAKEGCDQKQSDCMTLFKQRSRDCREIIDSAAFARNCDGPVPAGPPNEETDHREDWKADIRLLLGSFGGSAFYTLVAYFIPQLHHLPVFGLPLARKWLWTLNPSPAYVGQGIIMGPATTMHMLLGAIIGWAVLSPVAKNNSWAPGPVSDWETGSKGWIVWVSLAIMLADSLFNLGWLTVRPLLYHLPEFVRHTKEYVNRYGLTSYLQFWNRQGRAYTMVPSSDEDTNGSPAKSRLQHQSEDTDDAPPDQLISWRSTLVLLTLSVLICIAAMRVVFPPIPFYAIIMSVVLALLLGVMGVRAQGETDLNPVSGISKLTQLVFAVIVPASNPNAIIINLLAGAVSESGALQAGDMMQDLKTGHLLGASPKAQFWGQMIGSLVGAFVSAGVYRLYTSVYAIPGGMFQVPTAYVWIFTARLVTGKGLPPNAWQIALGAGAIFAMLTMLRIKARGQWWQAWVPGGIAVAVGMYNTPSFTLARAVGGVINWYWSGWKGRDETTVIVLASGLILGEGLFSIVNLGLASLQVPHL